jgi:hypothetical protein
MTEHVTMQRCGPVVVIVACLLVGCSSKNGASGGFNPPGTGDASDTDSGGDESGGSSGGSADGAAGGSSGTSSGSGSGSGGGRDAGHDATSTTHSGPSEAGASDGAAACPAPPSGAPANAVTAWQLVNQTRVAAGAGCMNLVAALDESAQAYCSYEATNSGSATCDPEAHTEVTGCSGFTGADVQTREEAAGYPQSLAYTEVATSFGNDPTDAVPSWINTVFHRIPLLDPWTVDMGYGGATGCDAIDIGRGTSTVPTSAVVVYPYDGQTNVPPAFSGLEGPTPPAPDGGYPSSYPINIYAQGLSVTQHVLTKDGDSTPIDCLWLDQNSTDLQSGLQGYFYDTAFMYGPPFDDNTTYHVQIVGTFSGGTLNEQWSFTTGSSAPVN